jgi:hypothetical protein
MAASKVGDISAAVDLILQPLLLEALVAIDDGKALEDALPADTDSALLDAAVQRLVHLGAVKPSAAGPFGRHELTARGRELVSLLEDLETLVPPCESAGHVENGKAGRGVDQRTDR